ncbi:hypothetical protein ACFL50_03050 [Candidatus Latescibacterota bacterium]
MRNVLISIKNALKCINISILIAVMSLAVGTVSIYIGVTAQQDFKNSQKEVISTLIQITDKINDSEQQREWANLRYDLRSRMSYLSDYLTIFREKATNKDWAANSCLHPAPDGRDMLETLGIIEHIAPIVAQKNVTIRYTICESLSTDFIQEKLYNFYEENKDKLVGRYLYKPDDLEAVLGTIIAYCNELNIPD